MKVTPHQERFLEQVAAHGIEFATTHWAVGVLPLRAGQIEPFTEDPDQFVADLKGVTKEQLLAWGEFQRTWHCLGVTKSGERCRARVSEAFRVAKPEHYSPENPNCYCSRHKEQAGMAG